MPDPRFDPIAQGVSLALEAHRRGLIQTATLTSILEYYDKEGARQPASVELVLSKLAGLDATQVAALRLPQTVDVAPPPARTRMLTPRLELLEELGAGAMGSVYSAFDSVLGRQVAVKLVKLPYGDEPAVVAQRLARFEREAKLMARIRHPSCVQVFDAGLSERGEAFLVMEYVRGRSLERALAEGGPLSPRQAVGWGAALADALQACHDAGVIHRDVKPANVLIDELGCPRLTDFGVAFDAEAVTRLTAERSFIGTLMYMAPEQMTRRNIDARADIYSLGATLYECLTGRPPFVAEHMGQLLHQVVQVPPISVRRARGDVPVGLDVTLLRALSKDPEDRPETAAGFAKELRASLRSDGRRSRLVLGAGVAAVVCSTALIIGMSRSGGDRASAHGIVTPLQGTTIERDATSSAPAQSESPAAEPAPSRLIVSGGEIRNERDGSTLIWIPPSRFVMGSESEAIERPPRVVRLSGYYIGRHEVTWGQFRKFCAATGRAAPDGRIGGPAGAFEPSDDHPVFNVSWEDATAYCRWADLRLASEAEWERAARGDVDRRPLPWGRQYEAAKLTANIADATFKYAQPGASWPFDFPPGYDDGNVFPTPVGSYPLGASPVGCLDMAGNIYEWVEDWLAPYDAGAGVDPHGPPSGTHRVFRGGAWCDSGWSSRVTQREGAPPTERAQRIGFRVARSE